MRCKKILEEAAVKRVALHP